jgi:hypothetical protein
VTLVAGLVYLFLADGKPKPLAVAVAATIAATVGMLVFLMESPGASAKKENSLFAFWKGAAAGAAVFFAATQTAQLPGANRLAVYLLMAASQLVVAVVLMRWAIAVHQSLRSASERTGNTEGH